MTVKLAGLNLRSAIFLAPMAGITDVPFRNLVSHFGAGLVFSEMIASRELVTTRKFSQAAKRAGMHGAKGPTAVQIAGREASWMAECARICVDQGADLIDINMGCPAKKVTGGLSGSALLRHPDHALSLISAVIAAVDVPVTLKTRLGWDEPSPQTRAFLRRAQDAGIAMVTVHGRTRCQFYKGRADWNAVKDVTQDLSVPVIVNGDITSPEQAALAQEHANAAGVMVGRGARGRPWLLAEIAADRAGSAAFQRPTGDALCEMISTHYTDMLTFYGPKLGLRVARKHLGWYADGEGLDAQDRALLLTATDPETVLAQIPISFGAHVARVAA